MEFGAVEACAGFAVFGEEGWRGGEECAGVGGRGF
jgi:hypothetical protein